MDNKVQVVNRSDVMKSWGPTLVSSALLFAFAIIAQEVMEGEPIAFDRSIMLAFRSASDVSRSIGPPWLIDVARDITALGSNVVLGLLVLIVTTFLFAAHKYRAGIFVFATIVSGAVANSLLKFAFARPRPDIVTHLTTVSSLSFPSGHAAISAVCYLTLGFILAQTQTSSAVRLHLVATALLLTFLVGLSRVYLGVHYPTDVLAGWCFGSSWALLCWFLMSFFQRRGEIEGPEVRAA